MGAIGWKCSKCGWISTTWVARCGQCFEFTMSGFAHAPTPIPAPLVSVPSAPSPYSVEQTSQPMNNVIDIPTTAAIEPTGGTLLERVNASLPPVAKPAAAPAPRDDRPQPLSAVRRETFVRYATEFGDMDVVLGGGLVAQSVIALLAEPGTGKSTLVLQVLEHANLRALYATNEETVDHVADRAVRIECVSDAVSIVREACLEKILKYARELAVQILVIDSLQTIYSESIESRAKVTQAALCARLLNEFAKAPGGPIVLEICQVSGNGGISGPKEIEHGVDVVLELERVGDPKSDIRRLSTPTKNRFGATTNVARYRMGGKGLIPLKQAVEPEPAPNDDDPDEPDDPPQEFH